MHMEMVLAHFKNDTIKGTQELPLSSMFEGPLVCLEQAHEFLAASCPTLWFSTKSLMYKSDYWSTICSKVSRAGGACELAASWTKPLAMCAAGPHPARWEEDHSQGLQTPVCHCMEGLHQLPQHQVAGAVSA